MCLFSASIMALEAALPLGQRRAQRRARSGTIDAKDESDARSGEIFFLENPVAQRQAERQECGSRGPGLSARSTHGCEKWAAGYSVLAVRPAQRRTINRALSCLPPPRPRAPPHTQSRRRQSSTEAQRRGNPARGPARRPRRKTADGGEHGEVHVFCATCGLAEGASKGRSEQGGAGRGAGRGRLVARGNSPHCHRLSPRKRGNASRSVFATSRKGCSARASAAPR